MDRRSRTILVPLASNLLLFVFKAAAGLFTGSVSLISEAANSATDVVASVVAFFAVRRSSDPPDANHHYGHARIENLAGVFEGLLIFGVGVFVLYTSVTRLVYGGELSFVGAGIGVMLVAAVLNYFVSRWLLAVARETDSRVIEAEGYNLLTDVWGAVGVSLGLVAVWVTGWTILDPIIAFAIGAVILWTGFRITARSARVLMDESLPERELELLGWAIREETSMEPRIRGFHKLRARKSGAHRYIDFHLQLRPETPLRDAHLVSDALEARIKNKLPNSDVLIHLEDDRSLYKISRG